MPSSPKELRRRLSGLMLRDERRLGRRLERARRRSEGRDRALDEVATEIAEAEDRVARRRASVPEISYPEELPVSQARDEIAEALREHQVVVVAGETGSGKTTQLPKLCLDLGRGVRGKVGHTQPRRLAARTVAARVAEELAVEVGDEVGYQVRFTDRSRDDTLLKVMTDGILLAETQGDPALRAYDTLIIDEAHERSLNVDFLLGYVKQLLPRRPDLKVIITSATIDVERFSEHFDGAPTVEVSGRTYPVEVRYRPLEAEEDDDEDQDQLTGIGAAVDELVAETRGDILVFLPGERDIRETAEMLEGKQLPGTEILPLYARQTPGEQQRVFHPGGQRRIVLATNVAETSLTVPGIRAVIDPGTARVSRYNPRTKVQRLPIEKVSQASARQRAGRCGRLGPGICIRLYAEEDFEARPEFTDPEVQRTNLASVILQMTALGLGEVEDFPFLDPPDQRRVRAAEQLLAELGAVERTADAEAEGETGPRRLTPIGRTLARLPVDPRLGRMLVEADRRGCVREVLVLVAALSLQDPRQRPEKRRQEADGYHGRFADETSDFAGFVNLWEYLREQRRALSGNRFRRRCREEFLHHLRVREWFDLHAQLRELVREQDLAWNDSPADPGQVHRALLSGLLGQIGVRQREAREYQGPRNTRFAIWPGSAVAKSPPTYVMAGELVETSRLWARVVARIEPEWAEELGGHLVARSHSEPWWDRERGAAVAYERVTLYGVPLVEQRLATYARIDRRKARELFIQHALVEGEWETHHAFFAENRRLLEEASELEDRARRRDLIAGQDTLHAFYDARVPDDVATVADFDAWWKDARAEQPDLLTFTRELLYEGAAAEVAAGQYPDHWPYRDHRFTISYRFEPGAPDDGVTVHVPLAALSELHPAPFTWQVPGLRAELVDTLLRGLPKGVRRELPPIADLVGAVLARLQPAAEPITAVLAREVEHLTGVDVPRDAFDLDRLPDHLRVNFRVVDGERTVAEGRDLAALQRELAPDLREVVARSSGELERSGLTDWEIGALPGTVEVAGRGAVVTGYPALVDEGETAGVRVWLSEGEQARHHWEGTRRLLRRSIPLPAKTVDRHLDRETKLALTRAPHDDVAALLDDAACAAIDALMAAHGGPAWDAEGFGKLRDAVRAGLVDEVRDVLGGVREVVTRVGEAEQQLSAGRAPQHTQEDARAQLDRLVHPGFVTATGARRLSDLARYAHAVALRLEKARQDPARDRERQSRIAEVQQAYVDLLRRLGPDAGHEVTEIRWMIEELRVSLFAQQLGTRQRVSEQRILRAIADAQP
ncbi:ATP-dependent RNA helicase HrpA [Egibacter rhizosphaerae]|uniref:RNA helicase n=1 Tax=Egibacter rhizosphaerae TaxID=1670831 RepID=A0A411YET6_9ACTN|nr:ATP-dependent RNA helicase HrpA [Egibacter rhizosphaerae]QBI19774.1 ATP-dependent RNA helicase HrpA [Egibacter rhizosphaerae]